MEERLAATEESLKVRVTQMEVAIMGALRNGAGTHASSPSRTPRGDPDVFQLGGGLSGGVRFKPSPPSESDNSEVHASSYAYEHELHRHGQTVTQMQSLVEGDAEIRAILKDLRRQARRDTLLRGTPGDVAGSAKPRSRLLCGGCADSGGGERFRRCLQFFGPVLHPDARFRSTWNVLLAMLIVYCGIAIPFGAHASPARGRGRPAGSAACTKPTPVPGARPVWRACRDCV